MPQLTHTDADGRARMVDVSGKPPSRREARAHARVRMQRRTLQLVVAGGMPKGDVLACARIAGIQAAKRTSELIPLCHPLRLSTVDVDFVTGVEDWLEVVTRVVADDRTGVEMEALTAAAVAALTVYDMCKAAERGICITDLELLEKQGGRSGHWRRDAVGEDAVGEDAVGEDGPEP
jgi:cyclic pyranopterin phosphate synthase